MFSGAARAETSMSGMCQAAGRAFAGAKVSSSMRSQGNAVLNAWRTEQAKVGGWTLSRVAIDVVVPRHRRDLLLPAPVNPG